MFSCDCTYMWSARSRSGRCSAGWAPSGNGWASSAGSPVLPWGRPLAASAQHTWQLAFHRSPMGGPCYHPCLPVRAEPAQNLAGLSLQIPPNSPGPQLKGRARALEVCLTKAPLCPRCKQFPSSIMSPRRCHLHLRLG